MMNPEIIGIIGIIVAILGVGLTGVAIIARSLDSIRVEISRLTRQADNQGGRIAELEKDEQDRKDSE